MVEASTPMRSPRTSPRSAIKARTQPNTVSCTSWGRRLRVFDSQEWSGTRSVVSRWRNSRNENESEQRHSIPRSLSIPSKYPTMLHAEVPAGRHRGRAHGLGVERSAGVLHEAVEPSCDQHLLQPIVEHVTRRARHLGPHHHQVALTIALPTHRHSQTPVQSPRTTDSDQADFVNGLLGEGPGPFGDRHVRKPGLISRTEPYPT